MYPNLKAEMARADVTPSDLAGAVNITVRAMYDKLNGKCGWTFSQAVRIREKFFPGLALEYLFSHGDGKEAEENGKAEN